MSEARNAVVPPQVADGIGRLLELFKSANAEQKDLIRNALGVTGGIRKRKRQQSNSDAKQFVSRFGEAIHKEGFKVEPPSGITSRGAAAVRVWHQRREENQGISDAELDGIVESAVL